MYGKEGWGELPCPQALTTFGIPSLLPHSYMPPGSLHNPESSVFPHAASFQHPHTQFVKNINFPSLKQQKLLTQGIPGYSKEKKCRVTVRLCSNTVRTVWPDTEQQHSAEELQRTELTLAPQKEQQTTTFSDAVLYAKAAVKGQSKSEYLIIIFTALPERATFFG